MPTTTPPLPLEVRPSVELIRLARATRPDVARESLKVLSRRRDPAAAELAGDLLLHHADQNVRATAAVMLGREPGESTQHALIRALGDRNPTVLRRVAQSLGRTGDFNALQALRAVDVAEQTPAGRAVITARTLLSYRLGVPDLLVEPERSGLSAFRVTRGADITWGGRLPRSRDSITADAARELPGIDLEPTSMTAFVCSGQSGVFVASRAMTTADAGDAFARPTLAGALLRERPCSERFGLDAYVLIDDRDHTDGNAAHVWLMRPDGTLLHHGRATATDRTIEFTITDSNAPYSRPVRIEGGLNRRRGRLIVTTAVVGKPRTGSARATAPEPRPVRSPT